MLPRDRARQLRQQAPQPEQKLWSRLRDRRLRNAKFRRQYPIGPYIVDFCCREQALVIELDGGHHACQQSADQRRTEFLQCQGYTVLRFWNHEVMENLDAVLFQIDDALKGLPPAVVRHLTAGLASVDQHT